MQNKKTNILYLGMGFWRNLCKVGQAQKRPYVRREKTHLQRKNGPHKEKRLLHGEKAPHMEEKTTHKKKSLPRPTWKKLFFIFQGGRGPTFIPTWVNIETPPLQGVHNYFV